MSTKRRFLVVLVIAIVVTAIGVQAQIPAGETVQGTAVPYSGRLTDETGQPVADGTYDFSFALYDAPTGGEPLWSEVQEGIAVKGGNLVALLGRVHPIPGTVLSGSDRWVAVGARGPAEAEFTALAPRQRMSAETPAAPAGAATASTCTHDHWGESWSGSGHGLSLTTNSIESYGVFGENTLTSGVGYGVMGKSNSPTGVGVKGINESGVGVNGYSSSGIALLADGTGVIASTADSVLYLSPQDLMARSTNVTLTPLQGGGVRIHNDAGSGVTKYFTLPASAFGTLYGAPIFVKSLEVCYKVTNWTSIEATTVSKSDGTEYGETYYIYDLTTRNSVVRSCYTLTATPPRMVIDNSTWVQFNISFSSPGAEANIYKVKLTVTGVQTP